MKNKALYFFVFISPELYSPRAIPESHILEIKPNFPPRHESPYGRYAYAGGLKLKCEVLHKDNKVLIPDYSVWKYDDSNTDFQIPGLH